MRGQRHIIRSRLAPARDGGEQSQRRGSLRCRSSVLTAVVEPTLSIYKQDKKKIARRWERVTALVAVAAPVLEIGVTISKLLVLPHGG